MKVGLPVGLRSAVKHCGSTFIIISIITVIVWALIWTIAEASPERELVRVGHEVKAGETLDTITRFYLPPDREFLEFREGIYQLNYERVFEGRGSYEVHEKDYLIIQFWAVIDYD